jgi:hypothetical protein
MWHIEVVHGSFYPDDEPGALGVLFGVDSDDESRVALIVDPEWLRTLLAGIENGHDMGRMQVPPSVSLPVALQGWDDDWDEGEHEEIDHMHWLFRSAGWDWPLLRKVVDLLEGLEDQED